MTHYFHIHEEQWRTISRDGHRPAPWERGLQDTWQVDPGREGRRRGHFHRLRRDVHGALPHARPRGRRADGAVQGGEVVPTTTVAPRSSSLTIRARQPGVGHQLDGGGGLVAAGLDEQVAAGREPARRLGDHRTLHVEPVRPAVERDAVLVVARLARHEGDRPARHVRRVGEDHLDPPVQSVPAAGRTDRPRRPRRRAGCVARTQRQPDRRRRRAVRRPGPPAATAAPSAPVPQQTSTTTLPVESTRRWPPRPSAPSAVAARRPPARPRSATRGTLPSRRPPRAVHRPPAAPRAPRARRRRERSRAAPAPRPRRTRSRPHEAGRPGQRASRHIGNSGGPPAGSGSGARSSKPCRR